MKTGSQNEYELPLSLPWSDLGTVHGVKEMKVISSDAKVVLTFEYVDEILKCDHSHESY